MDRTKGIGGSDAASILNISQYKSAYQLYFEKIGEIQPVVDNQYVEWGNRLEPVIADAFAEKNGKQLKVVDEQLVHEKYPFITANIDRDIVGEDAGLEIKTAIQWKIAEFEDQIPDSYMAQIQHYMLVTGYSTFYIAALIGGSTYKQYAIDRDNTFINDVLLPAEIKFWNENVLKRVPPQVIHLDSDSFEPSDSESVIELPPENENLVQRYTNVSGLIKELDTEKKTIQAQLKQFLSDHNAQYAHSDFSKISFKPLTRAVLDSKALKEKHPDIYKLYTTERLESRLTIRSTK